MDRSIRQIAHQEWGYHHRNAFNWMALYILPIVFALLVSYIYDGHVLMKMPTVIVDQDKSISSLRLSRMLAQHRFIHIMDRTDDISTGYHDLRTRKAYALILIPRDFEKNWKHGDQPVLKAYSYGTNLVVGKSIQKAIVETIGQLSGEVEAGKLMSIRHESIALKKNYPPLALDYHNLYNPSFNYQWFLPPGAIISLFQMLIVMLGATAFCTKKRNHKEQQEEGSFFTIYLGKLTPIIVVYTIQGFLLWLILFPLFGIPVRGNLLMGLLLWELFVISCYSIGFAISALIKDSMISTVVSVFIMAPAFAFSGYTYPYWEMPLPHRIFALAMPTTHFLPSFLQFYLQGSSATVMLSRFPGIGIFLLCLFCLLLISKFVHKLYPNGWEILS
ncbi:MAG TPA: ABC transporter permease [Candidatus Cloacimonadota bacterium]|nr:ABC transporter permease [Candidatus Cloacimonadota bacterium]HPT70746.1 ABC transporter permease [Candidatus Cloacimonadota bacterium]